MLIQEMEKVLSKVVKRVKKDLDGNIKSERNDLYMLNRIEEERKFLKDVSSFESLKEAIECNYRFRSYFLEEMAYLLDALDMIGTFDCRHDAKKRRGEGD